MLQQDHPDVQQPVPCHARPWLWHMPSTSQPGTVHTIDPIRCACSCPARTVCRHLRAVYALMPELDDACWDIRKTHLTAPRCSCQSCNSCRERTGTRPAQAPAQTRYADDYAWRQERQYAAWLAGMED